MDRSIEPRRANMAATNGLSRRRHRSTGLRDSPEDGHLEPQETVRLRDRVQKKERDRELSNRNKRRRGDRDRYVQSSNREEGEESSDESVYNDEDDHEEDERRVNRTLPSNHPSPSSSISNHSHRRSFMPARVVRSPPVWKPDEMIGVPIPRKARSASAKRSLECCVSARKKIKPIGPKTRLPKASSKLPSSSSLVQNDIEIEVAEALYDLMKQSRSQSQSSKKQETTVPCSKRRRPEEVKEDDEKAVVLTQNGSVPSVVKADSELPTKMETEMYSPKLEKKACEEAIKQEEKSKPPTQESKAKEEVADLKEEETPPCAGLVLDDVDLTRTKANPMASEFETQGEAKFEIDLMAPPVASSPERDGIIDVIGGPKIMAQDVEMKTETVGKFEYKSEQTVKSEAVIRGLEVKKMDTINAKQEQLKVDMEKPDQDNGGASGSSRLKPLDRKQQQQSKSTIVQGEKSAQSSSLPLPIAVAGWPGSLPLGGYMPPLQTIMPMGGTTVSSPALQPPHFTFSQPRPKRCTTHHYIAHNIHLHQQFTKMNHIWSPATAGAASVYGAKPYNVNVNANVVPSAQNMYHDSPLLGGFPGEKGRGLASVSSLTGKDKSSEVASVMDATQKKPLVLQQAPQPVPAGNLLPGPAFIFPLSQHQTAATVVNEAGRPKSAASASNGPLPGNLAMGAPVSSSSLPATASAVSFNYANFPANEAPPYMAILQNNGYQFPISTHVGVPPPVKGGTHNAPAMSFFNGAFYSSPVFHPSQDQQQQFRSQHLKSPSSGSSSSHKQPQSQQQQATQVTGNHFLTSTTSQLQQPQKQHVLLPSHSSRKHGAEMTGEDSQLIADNRADNRAQKGVYSQNFAVPIQPMNFALMPSVTFGCNSSRNHGEKQQQEAKGGVELIPPQAFALSFASFNGNGTASAHNFSSMAPNPVIFQTLPDMARHGYQIAPAPQVVHQKNEGKTGGDSTNPDEGRKSIMGKSPTNFGQSLSFSKPGGTDSSASVIVGTTVYDNSARTLNFISSPVPGNRPSRSTSTAMTTASVTVNPSNSQQQQQLIQIQKQHMMQQEQMHQQLQQQQQHSGATRIKAPASYGPPASAVAVKFPNNTPAFSQTLKNPQQLVRTTHGQTQISFGGNSKSGTAPPHGQQIVINKSAASLVGSAPSSSISRSSGSSPKTASMGSKTSPAISVLPSQQSEGSSNGPSQKTSPVCGRTVPSILSTCPTHLSELKY